MKSELLTFFYAFCGWWKPQPPIDNHRLFSLYRESNWGPVLVGLLFLILFEGAGLFVILSERYPTLGWIHLFLSVYGFIWLLGDYQAIVHNPLRIEADSIHIDLGLRWKVRILLRLIDSIEFGEPTAPDQEMKMGQFLDSQIPDYCALTLSGPASIVLKLKSPVVVNGLFGIKKTVSRIGLAPDNKEAFIQRIQELNERAIVSLPR